MHGVLAMSDHSIDRKREEKSCCVAAPLFYCVLSSFFLSASKETTLSGYSNRSRSGICC